VVELIVHIHQLRKKKDNDVLNVFHSIYGWILSCTWWVMYNGCIFIKNSYYFRLKNNYSNYKFYYHNKCQIIVKSI
jgi:hypothetical protein